MAEDEEEIEIEEEPDDEEAPPETPPKKLLGKFDSVEELERAYAEEESKLTKLAQENAVLRKAQESTQQLQPQNPASSESGDPWEGAFDSEQELGKRVQQTVFGAIGQFSQITRNADANIENIILERESDPMFKEVGRAFRAELKRVEPQYMLDPNQAAQIAENIYNTVCGKHARTILAKTRENPGDRTQYLKSLGVESPQPKDDTDVEAVSRRELEMLRGLGLTKKSREQVIRRVSAQHEEEEE